MSSEADQQEKAFESVKQAVTSAQILHYSKIEKSSDVAALQRLVSLVDYLSKFLYKLSELYEPLR